MESERVDLSLQKMELYGIHIIDDSDFEELKTSLMKMLPQLQQERISLFKKPKDMQRSLIGESMCRFILGERLSLQPDQVEISKSAKGKPFLKSRSDLHFNISHSGNWAVFALSDSEIGVDVEKVRAVDYRVARRYFSTEEFATLDALEGIEKRNYFFRLWTIKESYLKFLGRGLTKSLGSFTVFEKADKFRIKHQDLTDEKIFFNCYDVDSDHVLAVCSGTTSFPAEIKTLKITDLLKRRKT